MADKFTFYRSFFTACNKMDDSTRLEFFDAITCYVFSGVQPSAESQISIFFDLVKPILDSSISNSENGKKGGRPSGKTGAKTTDKSQEKRGVKSGQKSTDESKRKDNNQKGYYQFSSEDDADTKASSSSFDSDAPTTPHCAKCGMVVNFKPAQGAYHCMVHGMIKPGEGVEFR